MKQVSQNFVPNNFVQIFAAVEGTRAPHALFINQLLLLLLFWLLRTRVSPLNLRNMKPSKQFLRQIFFSSIVKRAHILFLYSRCSLVLSITRLLNRPRRVAS